jgi:NADH-quinone oxidoreductase subunit L
MQLSLGLLAFGALTTWLLAGPFSAMLAETLPHHDIHELSLLELAEEVFLAWPTYLALAVVGIGMAAWFGGRRQATVSPALLWLEGFNRTSFGFDPLNRAIASLVMRVASVLQRTQTGKLNWNIVGLVTALAAVLAFLIWSA